MKKITLLFLISFSVLVDCDPVPRIWEAFQINRYVNTETGDKKQENKLSITVLKTGDTIKYINNINKNDNTFDQIKNTQDFDNFVKYATSFFNKIDKIVADSNKVIAKNITKEDDTNKNVNSNNSDKEYYLNEIKNRFPFIKHEYNSSVCVIAKEYVANLAKVAVVYSDISQYCADEISTDVSANDGVLIIVGVEENLTSFNKRLEMIDQIMTSNGLIHDKNNILSYGSGNNGVFRVYVTMKVLSKNLYDFVSNTDYDNAVRLTETVYDMNLGPTAISRVVKQLLSDGKENVMAYAYMLKEKKNNIIVKECFPKLINDIISGKTVFIEDYNRISMLDLSFERDEYEDRWLQTNCFKEVGYINKLWHFVPVWNDKSLSFRIKHNYYYMDLKVDVNTVKNSTDRLVWGDHRSLEERFKWRLVPVPRSSFTDLVFCIVNTVYNQHLASNRNCDVNPFETFHVRVVYGKCTVNLGWVIQSV